MSTNDINQIYSELGTLTYSCWKSTTDRAKKSYHQHPVYRLPLETLTQIIKIFNASQDLLTVSIEKPLLNPQVSDALKIIWPRIMSEKAVYSPETVSTIKNFIRIFNLNDHWQNASWLQKVHSVNIGKIAIQDLPIKDKKEVLSFILKAGENLKYLDLRDTNMFNSEEIAEILFFCPNLEELYIGSTRICNKAIERLPNLKHLQILYLSARQITELPENLGNLEALRVLNIHGKVQALPESIGDLKNLEVLEFAFTDVESLPESIGNLTKLTKLICFCTKIESFPDSFGNLVSLKKLKASDLRLRTLPTTFGNLMSLEYLNLSGNPIECLPKEIITLTNLKTLYLYSTKIKELPSEIGNLISLEEINVGRCRNLTSLPWTLKLLPKLRVLSLTCSKNISSLPSGLDHVEEIGMAGCSNMRIEDRRPGYNYNYLEFGDY